MRVPRAIADGAAGFWRGLSVIARRRLVAALAAAAVLLLFFAVAVPALPCEFPGGDSCPPPDDAQELVPAEALAYLHVNLDPETEQYERAAEVADLFPLFSRQIGERLLAGVPGRKSISFEEEIRPWFGGEAALAVLPAADGKPESVLLLEVDDSEEAAAFAEKVAAGTPATGEVEGVELEVDKREQATAQTDGFLVLGPREAVGSVIQTATQAEGTTPLADDEAARDARERLPDHRFAEAYLAADGVKDLVAEARGTLESLTPLLSPGATLGAAASLELTEEDGLELSVRSVLDPEKAEAEPGFFAAFPSFEPELPERLSSDSLAYVGIGEPRTAVTALVRQAAEQAPGVAAGFENLTETLRDKEEVDVERDLLSSLGSEAALAVQPKASVTGPSVPYLQFVAADVDEDGARRALAALQRPIAEAADPGTGLQAPVFGEEDIGGVDARTLQLTPTVELAIAVFDGLAAVATDPEGIATLAEGEGGLDSAELYEQATADFDEQPSLIAFLDLGELVSLGEQLGLAEDPLYATFAGEFRRLDALGLAVSASDEALSTDARLLLSEGEAPETETLEPAPVPAPSD